MSIPAKPTVVAIACGGTGGHLFPGIAIAEVLQQWGCETALLVSQKEVDQEAVKSANVMRVESLPAVALQNGEWGRFLRGSLQSYRICRKLFRKLRPKAVLAMGGFTSAPPVLAGKASGAATFLHESNAIPGRANRWLSPWVNEIFVGFPTAARRLYNQSIRHLGTPVRAQFVPADPGPCRMALGLDPAKPVLLVMGGSQGASGINALVKGAIPFLAAKAPDLQFIHLTGPDECAGVQAAYKASQRRATVRPFLTEMELGLGAATVAINRAGASSLAELAAMRVPSILVPYPHATDNHQLHNARIVAGMGAAVLFEQTGSTPANMAEEVLKLLRDSSAQSAMRQALAKCHFPNAANEIASQIYRHIGVPKPDVEDGVVSYPETSLSFRRPWLGPGAKMDLVTPSTK